MDQNTSQTSYAPRSPDLSAYHAAQVDQAPSYLPHQQHLQPGYAHPPPPPPQYHPPPVHPPIQSLPNQSYYPPPNQYPFSPQSGSRSGIDMSPGGGDGEWIPSPEQKPARGRPRSKKTTDEPEAPSKPAPGVEEGIDVKTKFPVARIKRIMQADDDVGKVAQVTPTAVSKALELFMISLVLKSASQARSKSSKKVTAAHLKQVVQQDEQFDFLSDIVSKIPDAPTKKEKAHVEDRDSEGAEGEPKKRRVKRKKADDDDF